MKKFIAVLFALVLLFSVSSFAEEPDVVGCWAQYSVLTTGAPAMSMLYLADDHVCYYLTQMFGPDEAGFGRTFVGTWEFLPDGILFVKIGNNATLNLELSQSGDLAVDTSTLNVFVNITPFTFAP
jgi:hypothetical protein